MNIIHQLFLKHFSFAFKDANPVDFRMTIEDAVHDVRPVSNETENVYPPFWWTGEIWVSPFSTSDQPGSYKAVVNKKI